jgi:hypothetical protein
MLTILGIRHHGPGSARSVRQALETLQPELVLVEGPPDANSLIPMIAHTEMNPPAALLLYAPANLKKAVYYPFAEFSPEWQAILYALERGRPVRFMDLPQANQPPEEEPESAEKPPAEYSPENDLFLWIAQAAGFSDHERWWEHFVEQRRQSGDIFKALIELMAAMRAEVEAAPGPEIKRDLLREASMRSIIRAAQAEGYQNIAVVCGAWHAPALEHPESYTHDAKLLKGLPKIEIAATWVPWTFDRLARRSGYGAGIESPGWYEHLWQSQSQIIEKWMVKVAMLMREQDLSISPAHAIEATRLAETLAALRQQTLPGLAEINEAIQAVFCFGEDLPMHLIHEKLTVGARMGKIPAEAPSVPLQRDLAAAQKRTRLEVSASPESLDLDLRKPLLLERSQLLHRLNLLDIPWGRLQTTRGAKGTFHELWQIEWKPEFAVRVIEASLWGNTVLEAATERVNALALEADTLPKLTQLVEAALLADLSESISALMARIQQAAATTGDIPHLMQALPPLANVLRYGNVRQTDTSMVQQVVDELVVRICLGLPAACSSLQDEAAAAMFEDLNNVQNAIAMLQNEAQAQDWAHSLALLADQENGHGLVRGRASRLLFEQDDSDPQTALRMSQALSPGTPSPQAAAWVQGFLHGGGQALIHHPQLWQVIDTWVLSLSAESFASTLPLLRRTFSTFPGPERRQIGEMARSGGQVVQSGAGAGLDLERAKTALSLVRVILGEKV